MLKCFLIFAFAANFTYGTYSTTNEVKAKSSNCQQFFANCRASCHSGYRANCGSWNGRFSSSTGCHCTGNKPAPTPKTAGNSPANALIKLLKSKSTSCSHFYQLCAKACLAGYSAGCGRRGSLFSSTTKCTCRNGIIDPSLNIKGAKGPDSYMQNLNDYRNQMLAKHNSLRAKHGSPALKLDHYLNAEAQKWAEHLAKTDTFEHSYKPGMGENLFKACGQPVDGNKVTQSWYDEIKDYNWNKPGTSKGGMIGHFTAVVWKATTKMGAGIAISKNSNCIYAVANYKEAGNMRGNNGAYYAANVKYPRS